MGLFVFRSDNTEFIYHFRLKYFHSKATPKHANWDQGFHIFPSLAWIVSKVCMEFKKISRREDILYLQFFIIYFRREINKMWRKRIKNFIQGGFFCSNYRQFYLFLVISSKWPSEAKKGLLIEHRNLCLYQMW